jgi:hypothetical protein
MAVDLPGKEDFTLFFLQGKNRYFLWWKIRSLLHAINKLHGQDFHEIIP